MSGGVQQSLFFLRLPDLKKLVFITLSLEEEDEELRSKQIKTCRELLLLYSDILASPALDSFTDITVVMAVSFFQKGIIQVYAQRHRLQLGSPQLVLPGVFQCCVSYSLITRLAPSWNKAGLFLISGKDFLSERGRMNAVSMELSTSGGQLCLSIEPNTVRSPPTTLEDFGLPPLVLKRFYSDPHFIFDLSSTGGAIWCHVLPSMKKGQIITIIRQLPRDGPFRTYRDLETHWNCLYGYRLPEMAEEEVVYCSVYFRLVGDRLFTYPLSCIRLQPVQRCPQVNLQGALSCFLSDIRARLQNVCGFPACVSSTPFYHTVGLNTAAMVQELNCEQANLTTSSSTRLVLTKLPAPPPRMVKPFFGSQPPPWTPLSQQGRGQGLPQSQAGTGGKNQPSSGSSSSCVSYFSCDQTAPSLSTSFPPLFISSGSSLTSSVSSSSSLPPFQPASSLTCSIYSSSSSTTLSPLPLLTQPAVKPAPKLVPIFKNKCPSHRINTALLRVQKQQQQSRRVKVMISTFRKNRPTAAESSSWSVSLPVPPPPIIPRFNPKPQSSTAPQPSAQLKHIFSLSPALKSKPGPIPPSKLEVKIKSKSILKTKSDSKTVTNSSCKPSVASPEAPQHLLSSDVSIKYPSNSSTGGVVIESKVKKSRAVMRDVDVEKMARNNQLSKVNSATLLAWLKERGAVVSANHRKEELMLKVIACLAEA